MLLVGLDHSSLTLIFVWNLPEEKKKFEFGIWNWNDSLLVALPAASSFFYLMEKLCKETGEKFYFKKLLILTQN